MRGADIANECLFRIDRVEDFIPANHPLRDIRVLVDDALRALDSEFQKMYAPSHKGGKPSIAPEKLIRASLLQALCSIRSERRLMEEIQYNLLYRWFVGLGFADEVWDATVFCHNRDRLLEHGIVDRLFEHVVHVAGQRGLLSNKHFSVDGTQLLA